MKCCTNARGSCKGGGEGGGPANTWLPRSHGPGPTRATATCPGKECPFEHDPTLATCWAETRFATVEHWLEQRANLKARYPQLHCKMPKTTSLYRGRGREREREREREKPGDLLECYVLGGCWKKAPCKRTAKASGRIHVHKVDLGGEERNRRSRTIWHRILKLYTCTCGIQGHEAGIGTW